MADQTSADSAGPHLLVLRHPQPGQLFAVVMPSKLQGLPGCLPEDRGADLRLIICSSWSHDQHLETCLLHDVRVSPVATRECTLCVPYSVPPPSPLTPGPPAGLDSCST